MTDDIWQREPIASPCVKICVLHPEARLCIGCYRTGAEIGGWMSMSDEERAAIMEDLPSRAPSLKTRRVGRAARMAKRA